MLTDKADIALLMKAAEAACIPPSRLKPGQPWTFTGRTAELLQASVESISPEKAAEWRSAAGGTISLETQAAELDLQAHTAQPREDLLKHDPTAVIQARAAQEQWEKDQLAAMETATKALEIKNHGQELDRDKKVYPANWQGAAMRRQDELNRAMSTKGWN